LNIEKRHFLKVSQLLLSLNVVHFYLTKMQSSHTLPDNCGKQFSGIHVKSVKCKHDEELGNAQSEYNFSNQYA